MSEKVLFLADLELHGQMVFANSQSELPATASLGTMAFKDGVIYAYMKLGGMETWYPFANKTNSYIHVQGLAMTTWTVQHNLGTENVWYVVKNDAGQILSVGRTHIDENTFQLNFTSAVKGSVVVVAPDTIDVPAVKATSINVGNGAVLIDTSGVRVNGEYVLTDASIDAQLDQKADKTVTYTKSQVDTLIAAAVAGITNNLYVWDN